MSINIISLFTLVIIWLGLNGLKIDIAIALPFLIHYVCYKLSILPKNLHFRFFETIKYFIWLIREIILSAIAVSKIAWRKNLKIVPILKPIVSIQNTKLGLVTYANSITLTPGTVTLSLEGNKLLIHALDIEFMNGLEEEVMDKRVKKIII